MVFHQNLRQFPFCKMPKYQVAKYCKNSNGNSYAVSYWAFKLRFQMWNKTTFFVTRTLQKYQQKFQWKFLQYLKDVRLTKSVAPMIYLAKSTALDSGLFSWKAPGTRTTSFWDRGRVRELNLKLAESQYNDFKCERRQIKCYLFWWVKPPKQWFWLNRHNGVDV